MDAPDTIGFIVACSKFFGIKPGQSLLQFAGEVRQLTDIDKEDLRLFLEKELGGNIRIT